MKYNKLGTSDLHVSEIALGTMTFGQQNTQADASEQLDYAVEQGVNFIDTAEMYPVPGKAETQGRTEAYIGEWLQHQTRDKIILATKVAGPSRGFGWIRNGPKSLDRANILAAIETSLMRLKADYIDLYQIHWPARNVPMFGGRTYDPDQEHVASTIEEQLTVLSELVKSGMIRYVGLSNETPWGVAEFVKVAERLNLQCIVSIQNSYSLLNRTFEAGLHEMCHREQVGLLAYSPLGFGHLTGKYLKDPNASGRITLFPQFGQRYLKPHVAEAVAAYAKLATQHGLSPAQMALSFVRSRLFVSSTIIGATTIAQLKENLSCVDLNAEILKSIEEIHLRYTNPAP